IAEEDKKLDEAKKKLSQIGSDSPVDLPPVISEEYRKKLAANAEADIKAEQQARIDAARKKDQAAASGPTANPLLDTEFSATGLENIDPVTLAGGQAQFADQQARGAALTAARKKAEKAAGAAPGTPTIGPQEAKVREQIAAEEKQIQELNAKLSPLKSPSSADLEGLDLGSSNAATLTDEVLAKLKADIAAKKQARIDAARAKDQAAAQAGGAALTAAQQLQSATGVSSQAASAVVGDGPALSQAKLDELRNTKSQPLTKLDQKALKQAENDVLQKAAKAAGIDPGAAKAAAGNLKAPSGRFAGSGTDFGTLEEIRKGKSFNQFKESVGPQNAQLFLDEKKDQAADRARQKQIAAEASDPRKRARRLADLEKEQKAQANREALLEKKGGFGEEDAERLKFLQSDEGQRLMQDENRLSSEKEKKELRDLQARRGLSTRIGSGEKRIQALSLGGQTGLRPSDATPTGATPQEKQILQQAEAVQAQQTSIISNAKAQQQVQQQTAQGTPTVAQGKIPNPAGQPADAKSGSGGAQAGGAQTLSDAVNTITSSTFAKDLLSAANKLSELETLNINFEGSIKPIEVILNGGGLLQQLTEGVKQELVPLISSAVQEQLRSIN
ncbi:MAG: hypothetical protein ACYS8Y_07180, partial [Planctomycetota bacterium]